MYNIQKIIRTTALLAGLFGLVGCGGTCCESDVTVSKGTPVEKQIIEKGNYDANKTNGDDNSTKYIPPVSPEAIITANGSLDFNITINHCHNNLIHFDSSNSIDEDGNVSNFSYMWTQLDGPTLSKDSSFDYRFKKEGVYEITLTITDEQNLTASDTVLVTVN